MLIEGNEIPTEILSVVFNYLNNEHYNTEGFRLYEIDDNTENGEDKIANFWRLGFWKETKRQRDSRRFILYVDKVKNGYTVKAMSHHGRLVKHVKGTETKL